MARGVYVENLLGQTLNWIGNLFRWWFVVAPWEQAVRVRGGKTATLLEAGIHFRIPGLDRIYRESTKLRTIDTGIQTVSTKDNHAVTLQARIRFRVENYLTVFQELHHAEDTLIDLTMSEIAEQVRDKNREELTPKKIESFVEKRLNADRYGLSDLGITITDFAFVKTFRLIQHDNRWSHGSYMDYEEVQR